MALSFRLESPAVPPTAKVIGFRGTEALTRPYVFDVYVATVGAIEIEPASVVGLPATLTIAPTPGLAGLWSGGPAVEYAGMIGRFQIVRATASSTLYKATLVPKLWQLAMTKHSRVFTKMSVPAVIQAVLSMEGIANVALRISGSYAPEEHITQYRESSLDFIHRWMEREGLYYYFEQAGGAETMVIVDSLAAHEPNAHGPVRYHPAEEDNSAGRHFDNFITGAMSLPATVRITDYDYAKPMLSVMGMSPVWPTGSGEMNESSGDARLFTPADAPASPRSAPRGCAPKAQRRARPDRVSA
jgi:type VI secretion system secreted protein VgrG